jgi:bifunctional enzyme CysN/CysC
MATGASTASLAILMIDARKGILEQTRRHAFIASLLGIKQIVLAVNKLDLVDYSEKVFKQISADFEVIHKEFLKFDHVQAIPLSALKGDNIIEISDKTPWYKGPTLMDWLETVENTKIGKGPLRLPIQYVLRPNLDYRGYAGRVASGSVVPGKKVKILPSGVETVIEEITSMDGALGSADEGASIAVTLKDEVDASRGDMIVEAVAPAELSDQFRVNIIWMHEQEMIPGRSYILKIEGGAANATIAKPRYKINVNNYERLPADVLELNDIGSCNISLDRNIAFDAYEENRTTGSFILIDRESNATVGAGLIRYALRRASNIHWQALEIDKVARSEAKSQKPCVLWFTGLSGSGKSTIANIVEKKLHANLRHTMLLDGDNVRHGLNRDLGFTDQDRVENIRRVTEVSKLMVEAGLITLVSFISPFASERDGARQAMGEGEFIEVFVKTSLAEAERRDVKGLYAKARSGELKNFTGIDSPYEEPTNPEIIVDTENSSAEECAEQIISYLLEKGYA